MVGTSMEHSLTSLKLWCYYFNSRTRTNSSSNSHFAIALLNFESIPPELQKIKTVSSSNINNKSVLGDYFEKFTRINRLYPSTCYYII